MQIYLAEHSGFCFGVKRAINIATKLVGEDNVYTLGQLIHNPQVVKSLEEKEKVGVTAGASTPDYLIKELIRELNLIW